MKRLMDYSWITVDYSSSR